LSLISKKEIQSRTINTSASV